MLVFNNSANEKKKTQCRGHSLRFSAHYYITIIKLAVSQYNSDINTSSRVFTESLYTILRLELHYHYQLNFAYRLMGDLKSPGASALIKLA